MSKKYSLLEKVFYHQDRVVSPSRFGLSATSSRVAYSEGFLGAVGHGPNDLDKSYWRGMGKKQYGAYNLGVAAGKKAARKARK